MLKIKRTRGRIRKRRRSNRGRQEEERGEEDVRNKIIEEII